MMLLALGLQVWAFGFVAFAGSEPGAGVMDEPAVRRQEENDANYQRADGSPALGHVFLRAGERDGRSPGS